MVVSVELVETDLLVLEVTPEELEVPEARDLLVGLFILEDLLAKETVTFKNRVQLVEL